MTAPGHTACDRPPDGQPDLGELTGSLGFLLRLAQINAFDLFYRTLGDLGLKPGQFSVLWVVHLNPGVRQGTVAEALQIKPAHMTKMIRACEENGLVDRHIPATDRRGIELRLTREGTDFVTRNAPSFFTYCRNEHQGLSPAEADQLVDLLQKFIGSGGQS